MESSSTYNVYNRSIHTPVHIHIHEVKYMLLNEGMNIVKENYLNME